MLLPVPFSRQWCEREEETREVEVYSFGRSVGVAKYGIRAGRR